MIAAIEWSLTVAASVLLIGAAVALAVLMVGIVIVAIRDVRRPTTLPEQTRIVLDGSRIRRTLRKDDQS